MPRAQRFTLGLSLAIVLVLLGAVFAGVVYLSLLDARQMAARVQQDLERQNDEFTRAIDEWYLQVVQEHARQIAAPFLWNVESLEGLDEGTPAFRHLQRRMWQFVYGKDREPAWHDSPVGPLESVLIVDRHHRIVAASDPMVVDRTFTDPEEIARLDRAIVEPQVRRIHGERDDGRSVVELSLAVPNSLGEPIGVVRLRYVGGVVGRPPQPPTLAVPDQPRLWGPALAGLVAILGLGFGIWATNRVFSLQRRLEAMARGLRLPPSRGAGAKALSMIEERLESLSESVRRDDLLVASLSDALREGVILVDPDGRPVIANRQTEEMFQLGREEGDDRLARVAAVVERNLSLKELVEAGLERGRAVREHPLLLHIPWVGPVAVQVTSYVLRDGERTAGLMLVLKDRASIESLERNLREASRLQTIVRLTGSVAHEVKNPLGAITVHLEQLRRKVARADEARKARLAERVDVVCEEIARLREILAEWLQLTSPEERGEARAPVVQVLDSVGRLLRVEARHQGVELVTEHFGEDCRVALSAARLRQVLLNLALNGLQAMPDGGRLVLRARVGAQRVAFEVEDTGAGIPREVQDKIFDFHFTTRSGGSGLGLSICRMMVEEAGGILTFVSEEGKGTTFQVFLPPAQPGRQAVTLSAGA